MSLPLFPEGLPYKAIGGMDEVGRGPGAGPVVSALVILPEDFECDLINDSKKLTDKKRREAYDIIIENAIAYSVQAVGVNQINKMDNIDNSIFLSMQKCIDDISTKPDYLLIDGNRWDSYKDIPFETVVKGDGTYMTIAAASILAKVRRDDYMIKLSEMYPHYGWESNKGYLSKKHIEGIKSHGPTDYHRTKYIRNFV
jgi:ribonuclease HII